MFDLEEKSWRNEPTIGYWSAYGGVEIKAVSDTHIICVSGAWIGQYTYHLLKVHYSDAGNPYVVLKGTKLFFHEAVRC